MDIKKTVNIAKRIIDTEVSGLNMLKASLDEHFAELLSLLMKCEGKIVFSGVGKSGVIAQKAAATFSSLGLPSFFVHPTDAKHGDFGVITNKDIVILISNSGETAEIIDMIPTIKIIGSKLVAVTSKKASILSKEADFAYVLPDVEEACLLKLAPTSSTTCALVFFDALAVAASEIAGFSTEDFALLHPAGTIGKKALLRIQDIMVSGKEIPIVERGSRMSEAIVEMSNKGLGMLLVVDDKMHLVGIITDGDLRRAIEKKVDLYDGIVDDTMTENPMVIREDMMAVKALNLLKKKHLNNFPVVDKDRIVVGAVTWQMIIRAGVVE